MTKAEKRKENSATAGFKSKFGSSVAPATEGRFKSWNFRVRSSAPKTFTFSEI
jgi:hypothetical protein